MGMPNLREKRTEWLKRYIPAEIAGTAVALACAWIVYAHIHTLASATGAGWLGEGIGFYGYFIVAELTLRARWYQTYPLLKRIALVVITASTNLFVEFMPAEIFDNFIIRPFLMYMAPQYIHPYPLGFLAGKFSADILFYVLAIAGYEARKRWLRRQPSLQQH